MKEWLAEQFMSQDAHGSSSRDISLEAQWSVQKFIVMCLTNKALSNRAITTQAPLLILVLPPNLQISVVNSMSCRLHE